MRRRSAAFGALALAGTGVVWASLTLTPASYDFGQHIVGDSVSQEFVLTGTTPLSSRGIPAPTLKSLTRDFFIDMSGVPLNGALPNPKAGAPSTCLGTSWAQTGSCTYAIVFRPLTRGKKTAQLVVQEGSQTVTATITGEGIFGCRPYLVSCNYADVYIGTYNVTTDEAASVGNHRGHWVTTVTIEVLPGGPTCSGTQNDWEEDWNDGKLWKRSTATGSIDGPGLFAIEFRKQRGGKLEYVLSFACPSPTLNTTEIDHIAGTSSAGRIPSEPADWRRGGLAADPQPATQIGQKYLDGSQRDPRVPDGTGSGVTGWTTMTWRFHRWP